MTIDNETGHLRSRLYWIDYQSLYSQLLFSFFFLFLFLHGSEASKNCQLSIVICQFFFWRISAKRNGRLYGKQL